MAADPAYSPANPRYWDPGDLLAEQRRQFDVCHGCRLCWNLCPSFPALFELTDSVDGELSKVDRADLRPVEDLCFQCKICWVVCPYTDPHEYDMDVPRLFQRAKFVRAKEEGVGFTAKLMADQDRMGKLGSMSAPLANATNRFGPARRVIELVAGVHRDATLPTYHRQTFEAWFQQRYGGRVFRPAGEPVRKVAFFTTCTVNYNAPEIAIAAMQVLEHNNVEVVLPPQVCCGMPMMDAGDFDGAQKKMEFNLRELSQFVDEGYDVVTPGPTCALTIRSEYPENSTDSETAKRVAEHTFELGHYLVRMARGKVLERDFKQGLGKVALHVACHTRAQSVGNNSGRLLGLLPDTEIASVEMCSGHDGTWGVKKDYHELSLQVGSKLFDNLQSSDPALIVTDCPLAAMQIEHAIGRRPVHTAQALAVAYGLDGN